MEDLSTAYLRRKRKRLIQQLAQLEPLMMRGSIVERYKKCGKPNCKCSTGKGHGPKYYYTIALPKQSPVMVYIPTNLKNTIGSAISNYQKAKKIMEELSHVNRELLIRKQL